MKNALQSVAAFFASVLQGLRRKFTTHFPGKSTINARAMAVWGAPIILVAVIIYSFLASPDDTSRLTKTAERIDDKLTKTADVAKAKDFVKGIAKEAPAPDQHEQRQRSAGQTNRVAKINYRAKQVIERGDYSDPNYTLPTGTEFVGRLVTSIDTRNAASLTKIELPFGGSFQGNELIPRGSVLFATTNYDGNGEKIFLDIQSGQLPDGQEFRLRAQALSSKDFSPGLAGDYHGTLTNRVASNLGLSFVSSLTDTLIEKESIGTAGAFSASPVAPKPTVRNGVLSGLSKVTDMESKTMAQELASQKPFVTVDSGKELIVSLLERFVKGGQYESGQKGK